MKDLFEQVMADKRAKRKAGLKERYHLAKDLGFSAADASYLCQWSKQRIINLAKSRGYQIPPRLEAKQEV